MERSVGSMFRYSSILLNKKRTLSSVTVTVYCDVNVEPISSLMVYCVLHCPNAINNTIRRH